MDPEKNITSSTPRPQPQQGPSWRSFAEAWVFGFVATMLMSYIKDTFKFNNFFLECAIYASFFHLFKFLYQKLQSLRE